MGRHDERGAKTPCKVPDHDGKVPDHDEHRFNHVHVIWDHACVVAWMPGAVAKSRDGPPDMVDGSLNQVIVVSDNASALLDHGGHACDHVHALPDHAGVIAEPLDVVAASRVVLPDLVDSYLEIVVVVRANVLRVLDDVRGFAVLGTDRFKMELSLGLHALGKGAPRFFAA